MQILDENDKTNETFDKLTTILTEAKSGIYIFIHDM